MFHHVSRNSAFVVFSVLASLSGQRQLFAQTAMTVAVGHSVAVNPGRFTASGGDISAVTVNYSAAGGTITPNGMYTAGAVPGTFTVVARSGALADTSIVTVTAPLGIQEPITREPINVPSRDRTEGPRPPQGSYESKQHDKVAIDHPDGTKIRISSKRGERWTFFASLMVLTTLAVSMRRATRSSITSQPGLWPPA